jgi:hypothetical protein
MATPKTTTRKKQPFTPKFDWSGFKLLGITGLVMLAFGISILWITYTAPEGVEGKAKGIGKLFSSEVRSGITQALGVGFMLFGGFLSGTAIFRGLKFLIMKK